MKCPACEEYNIGSYYIVCKECISRIVKNKINFTSSNCPREISYIFPEAIVDRLDSIIQSDITEALQLLRNEFSTPVVLMGSRIFENMIFDYFDEDFYYENELNEDSNEAEENESRQLWNYYGWLNFSGIEIYEKSEQEENDDEYPTQLAVLIKKLEPILSPDIVNLMIKIKDIRNEACHGNERYDGVFALDFLRTVLKMIVLVYNGNFGSLPIQ